MNHSPVQPGDVLAGKYEVERVLGVGGMGVVVAAHHLQLRQKVALKFLLPDVLLQPDAVERFEREARAAVRIKGEHVARVFDVGTLENGLPYMVVEFLDGTDLAHKLARMGPFPIAQAVDFVLQACEAMAEAHSLGIVHRDLKPSNLFVTQRPNGEPLIKVLDFGISKLLTSPEDVAPPSLTATNGVIGSPLYMSPEQVRNAKSVDVRTDIWSLGVILYEIICACPPFDGRMVPEVIAKIAADPPTPMRNKRPDIDPGLEQVILRCLEKDPARRYSTVAELAVALMQHGGPRAEMSLHRITANMRSLPVAEAALSSPSTVRLPTAETLTGTSLRPSSRRTAVTVVGFGVVMLAAVAVLAAVLVRNRMQHDFHPAQMLPSLPIDSAAASTSAAPDAAQSAQAPPTTTDVVAATSQTQRVPVASGPPSKTHPSTPSATTKSPPPPPSTTKGGIQDLINDRR